MSAGGNGAAGRRVVVLRPGDQLTGAALTGGGLPVDVAVVLLRQEDLTGGVVETLQQISRAAGALVVLIAGGSQDAKAAAALPGVRTAAAVVAHVGDDEQAVEDVVAALRATGR